MGLKRMVLSGACRHKIALLVRICCRWGAHLDMQIVYSNMWANLCSWFSPGPVKYTYQLQHVPVLEGVSVFFGFVDHRWRNL